MSIDAKAHTIIGIPLRRADFVGAESRPSIACGTTSFKLTLGCPKAGETPFCPTCGRGKDHQVVTNTVEVPFTRVRHMEPFASLGSDESGQWEGESFSEWLEENRGGKIGDLDMFQVPAFANPSILHPQPIYQLWIGKAIMSTGWWKLERGNRFTTSGMGPVAAILSDVRAALADLGIKQEPELCTFLDVG